MNESTSTDGGPVAVRIPAALLTAARLTQAQLDGHACVVCGRSYLTEITTTAHMPVGAVNGSQVFACTVPCTAPESVPSPAEEPVVVRSASLGKTYAIPAPPANSTPGNCPSWCDEGSSHRHPGLDTEHMGDFLDLDLAAHAGDEPQSPGYIGLYLRQDGGEDEPTVVLSGPSEDAGTEARMTLAEAELLHAALGKALAAARNTNDHHPDDTQP